MGKIKANLHGHLLPDFSQWWRKEFGIKQENLAKVAFDKCVESEIGIYAITNDPSYSNFDVKSRFNQVFEEARNLPRAYKLGSLGENAFVISNNNQEVYFIDGQSVRVLLYGENKEAEILSFGSGQIPNKLPINIALSYLHNAGLPAIAEHPLCTAHFGLGKENLEELCSQGKLTAVEHNSQLTLPNIFAGISFFGVNSYVRRRNTQAVEIATKYGIPVIASDDSNGINHIGTSYNVFPAEKIRLDKGENIVGDLKKLVDEKDFSPEFGYLSLREWINWTVIGVMGREKLLRNKWERKNT